MAGRNRLQMRKRRREVQRKYGLGRPPPFRQQPKGEIVFENKNAVPMIRGTTARWKIENVEWIRKRQPIGWGGFGNIFAGKIKIRGEPKPRTIIIKQLHQRAGDQVSNYSEILRRLGASHVRHPKMAFIEASGKPFLVSEPFLQKGVTKLHGSGISFFKSFQNLETDEQIECFAQCIRQTAFLAKAGLAIGKDDFGRVDAFHGFRTESGKILVLVSDIDLLYPTANPEKAWERSTAAIWYNVYFRSKQSDAKTEKATEIIEKIGKQYGF